MITIPYIDDDPTRSSPPITTPTEGLVTDTAIAKDFENPQERK